MLRLLASWGPRSEPTTACVYLLQIPSVRVYRKPCGHQICAPALSWLVLPWPGEPWVYGSAGCQLHSGRVAPCSGSQGSARPLRAAFCTKSLSLLSSGVFRTLANPTELQSDAGLCPIPYHSGLPPIILVFPCVK